MQLMDTSLEKLYTSVYEKLGERMPEEVIGKIVVAVVNALYYLKRELKIIHRDVKPSNILLDRQGSVRLCDFGISGQLIDSIAKTKDVGCRPYMSVSVMRRVACAHTRLVQPERLQNVSGYGVQSDVWSLGITIVEIATGRFPYRELNCVVAQLNAVVDGDPPILLPSDGNPPFTLPLVELVRACLAKDPTLRPDYQKLLAS